LVSSKSTLISDCEEKFPRLGSCWFQYASSTKTFAASEVCAITFGGSCKTRDEPIREIVCRGSSPDD